MSLHELDKLFKPKSIAVIGVSNHPQSVGKKLFNNLIKGKYPGKLFAVNPKYTKIQNHHCYASIKDIAGSVDLAIIITPVKMVENILVECGEKNIPAALIISAGFSEIGQAGRESEQRIAEIAKRYKVRIIGPNCLGIIRTDSKLNATFDNNIALPGNIALVSQSGALCAAILDWAADKKIGFSSLISLGNSADVSFKETLDYLAHDKETHSILLYIEGVKNGAMFLESLRAAVKLKPIIVIKSGRFSQGSRAALSHTGALIGNDDVFDAALRQSGAIRVMTIEQLFSAAKILSGQYKINGNRLTIITNGGGAGVMAADRAAELNISLPELNKKTFAELNKILPQHWSHQNPIDLIGDATPERYHHAIEICLQHEDSDGLLIVLVPVAMADPKVTAKQIIIDHTQATKPILTCWMGQKQVKTLRQLFINNQIPSFDTPEEAVEAFSYLAEHHTNQQFLKQVTKPYHFDKELDLTSARNIIQNAAAKSRKILTTIESKLILQNFSIPISKPLEVNTIEEAQNAVNSIGFPVVMKINSPEIIHKQEVGGVQTNIKNNEELISAFNTIKNNLKKFRPDVLSAIITVEKMHKTPNDRELAIGIKNDVVFGPVINFGAGGTLIELIKDQSIAIPPLNPFLANHMIAKSKISKLLGQFRAMPAVNFDNVIKILLQVSQMAQMLPIISELDINPLIVNEEEAIAVDARIILK